MKFTTATIAALAGAAAVTAQSNTSICDKYSQALFMSTNGTVQKTLLTLVVNSALIGNYSPAATKQPIPSGILTKNGTYQGQTVNLLKYFDGSLLSTNRNGMPSSVNFLDGGGAAPLKENKPATDDNSNQAKLVNHLYSYFGYLLGCSSLGKEGFSNYEGSTSQYNVHKYMNLNPAEMGYFIQEVAYSALSFGVSMDDVQTVGTALGNTFNNKCANPAAVPASAQPAVQSICLDPSCPTAPNGTCSADNQGPGTAPAAASGASSGSGGSSASMTGSPSGTQTSSGAAQTSSRPNSADSLKAPAALLLGAAVGIAALV